MDWSVMLDYKSGIGIDPGITQFLLESESESRKPNDTGIGTGIKMYPSLMETFYKILIKMAPLSTAGAIVILSL